MNKALYPGSFDPFTNGHLSILRKAIKIFDKVVICISVNPAKKSRFTIESRELVIKKTISEVFNEREQTKISFIISDSHIPAKIAAENNCQYIIRGLRNNIDYDYEEGLANFNAEYDNTIETIYFRADNSTISSTMVNSLIDENINVQKYIPYPASWLIR